MAWSWGKIHKLTFNHPLASGGKLLEGIFNRGPIPIGGDQTTIWASGANYHNLETNDMIGPPYRMIVDLKDLENSISMLAPGQSGNPSSRYYDDQIETWLNQEYHPMSYSRQNVEEHARYRLKLIPN